MCMLIGKNLEIGSLAASQSFDEGGSGDPFFTLISFTFAVCLGLIFGMPFFSVWFPVDETL